MVTSCTYNVYKSLKGTYKMHVNHIQNDWQSIYNIATEIELNKTHGCISLKGVLIMKFQYTAILL